MTNRMATTDTKPRDLRWLIAAGVVFLGAPCLGYFASHQPKLALVAAFGSVAIVALARRPKWGVYALFIGTAFDSVNISAGFAILGAGDLSCLMLVPMWLLNRLVRTDEMRWPIGLQYLLAFFILSFTSMMLGVNPAMAYGGFARLVIYGITVVAVADLLRSTESTDRVLIIVAICSFLHALIALAMGAGANSRLGGLVGQPNLLGVKIAFGLFPMVGWSLRSHSKLVRAALICAVTIMLVAIILTISRGTYISVTLAFLWMARRNRRLVLLLAAAGGLIFFGASNYGKRETQYVQNRLTLEDSSVMNRGAVAKNAVRGVLENPLLGVGFGQFSQLDKVVSITSEAGRGGHSFYLSTAASSGIPALLLFILFGWWQARTMSRGIRHLESRSPETEGDEDKRNQWILTIVQTIMVFHTFSLTIRGAQRLTEWTMLALYGAVALLALGVINAQRDDKTLQSEESSDSPTP